MMEVVNIKGHEVQPALQDLIVDISELKADPTVDKKALNKTIARLEEAMLWSGLLVKPSPNEPGQLNGNARKCSCPEGAVDNINCQVHRAKA